MKCLAPFILWLWCLVGSATSEEATLKMRFVFDGTPPVAKRIGFAPGIGTVNDETLIVNPNCGGIQNMAFYVFTGRREPKIKAPEHLAEDRRMTMTNIRFDPRILLAQAGDSLVIVDRGPNQHPPVANFFRNNAPGPAQAAPTYRFPMPLAEPAPIPIDCNTHPWLRAYVIVLDHPFAAVSDSEGKLSISGLPANRELLFQTFHQSAQVDYVTLDGTVTELDRGRLRLTLDPGENDLGDVLIPEEAFIYR